MTPKNYDMDQLTAYALGEIEGAEKAELEQQLANDPEGQAMVEEIRAAASFAHEALHAPDAPGLTNPQREAVVARAGHKAKARWWGMHPALLAAAMLLVGAGAVLAYYVPKELELREQLAAAALETEAAEAQVDYLAESNAKKQTAQMKQLAAGRYDSSLGDPFGMPLADEAAAREQNAPAASQSMPPQGEPPAVLFEQAESLSASTAPAAPAAPMHAQRMLAKEGVSPSGASGGMVQRGIGMSGGGGGGMPDRRDVQLYVQTNRHFYAEEDQAWNYRETREGGAPDPYADPSQVYWPGHNTEEYARIVENPFKGVRENPLSTFSIDVDTASYANVRRMLNQGMRPPPGAVRIEEMVNYFDYDYAPPETRTPGEAPFASHIALAECPWAPEHKLARIALKGWEMPMDERPPANLVFLIDVSGSMRPANKLPLLKQGMKLLARQMGENDRIAIVVYAGAAGVVLESTPGSNQEAILEALDRLESGGSTHGSAGIQLAYETAQQHFIEEGVNRVVLATDGDFNVGTTNESELVNLIEAKAKSGVFLTVLGFGMGNLKDSRLEQIADKGNGNYAYIDSINEAKKVLVEQMGGTLVTIAKDVKVQVEFNPAKIEAYRLIGYENRILAKEDFNDDTKDAGEIGAGHTVTALYELVPAGVEQDRPGVDPLRYQVEPQPELSDAAKAGEAFTVKLRYKAPDGEKSKLLEFPVEDRAQSFASADDDFQFAAAVAAFGMLLRGSEYAGQANLDAVAEWAESALGADEHGYRQEFLGLVGKAKALRPDHPQPEPKPVPRTVPAPYPAEEPLGR